MRNTLFSLLFGVACLCFCVGSANAQVDTRKFEIGGQYSLLDFDSASFVEGRHRESGFGGRFGYNFNKYVAAEGQVDHFPEEDSFQSSTIRIPTWGRKTLAVAGVKAGGRTDRFGLFAKARPGVIHFSRTPGIFCVAAPCPQPAQTNFAFDVGGVAEFYPTNRTVIRVDAGDTIIRHQRFYGTTHQFQTSIGVGVRF